jgi:hypothetical protein
MKPITGIVDCCARAASGHAAAPGDEIAPPHSRFWIDFGGLHRNRVINFVRWRKIRVQAAKGEAGGVAVV